jgi:hypothetical protein
LSLIVANIPVVITTTIDIVGEDPAQDGKTVQFSTIFWFSSAQITKTMELHTIAEECPDPAKRSYAKTAETSTWNQTDLPLSEKRVVDMSLTRPVAAFVGPLLPISPGPEACKGLNRS